MPDQIELLANMLHSSKRTIALTGAGISKASGIPPFRGEDGIWNKYDPNLLELNFFYANPLNSWQFMVETFFKFLHESKPNPAHYGLAELEKKRLLETVITQNIDSLHQAAGSESVWEYHGGLDRLICTGCGRKTKFNVRILEQLPPLCKSCGSILKPDIVFFSESIPMGILQKVADILPKTDLVLVIGTSAEIYPASMIPGQAKNYHSKIVEINLEETSLTNSVSDLFVRGKAEEIIPRLLQFV